MQYTNERSSSQSTTLIAFAVMAIVTTTLLPVQLRAGPSNCVPPPSGILSWWDGDAVSGPVAADIADDNDGSRATPIVTVPGVVGQAFGFVAAETDPVMGTLNGFPGGDTPLTTMAWFRQPTAVGHPGIGILGVGTTANRAHFFLRTTNRGSDHIWDGGDGQNRVWIGVDDGGADKWWASNTVIATDQWYFVACTYDPPTRQVKLYVNGAPAGQPDRTVTLSTGLALATPFWIGGDDYDDNYWQGLIDEAVVLNRVLSPAEIQAIYAAGAAGMCKPTPGVFLYSIDKVNDRLVKLDVTTCAITDVGPLGVDFYDVDGLVASRGNELIATRILDVPAGVDSYQFCTIDSQTGAVTACVTATPGFGGPWQAEALGRNPVTGTVYSTFWSSAAPDGIHWGPVDMSNPGQPLTDVCVLPSSACAGDIDDLAFDSSGNAVALDNSHFPASCLPPTYPYAYFLLGIPECATLGPCFEYCQPMWSVATPTFLPDGTVVAWGGLIGTSEVHLVSLDPTNGAVLNAICQLPEPWNLRLLALPLTDCNGNGVEDSRDIGLGVPTELWGLENAPDQLFRIDLASGASTPGPVLSVQIGGDVGLEYDPLLDVFYAVDGAFTPGLLVIDPESGATEIRCPAGSESCINVSDPGLALDPACRKLYMVREADFMLFEIEISTGLATLIGPTGLPVVNGNVGLAYDTTRDALFLVRSNDSNLYRVDVATGVANVACSHGEAEGFPCLAYDPVSDGLYSLTGKPGIALYRMNPVTCELTCVPSDCTPTSFNNMEGLAIVYNATSPDCNSDAVPDECELVGYDCNGNGTLDECDLACGTSPDCNANGIPDECDIANCVGDPACGDCNNNGVPDECDVQGVQVIVPDEFEAHDNFSGRIAICGDMLLVGATHDDNAGGVDAGAVYVYRSNAGQWTLIQKLTAPDSQPGDWFGEVACDGDFAVFGAPGDDDHGNASGAFYVYQRTAPDNWTWTGVKQSASDMQAEDGLAEDLAISGDTVVAGARQAVTPMGSAIGKAYIFQKDAGGVGNWGQVGPPLTAGPEGQNADSFGHTVAIDGDIAVIGAVNATAGVEGNGGAAYVFERNAGGSNAWGRVAKLTASNPSDGEFSGRLDISGNVIAIGAYYANAGAGSLYVYIRPPGGWAAGPFQETNEDLQLLPPDLAAGDGFGAGISLDGNRLAVGAQGDDDGGTDAGAVYIYTKSSSDPALWTAGPKLIGPDVQPFQRMGAESDMAGSIVVTGNNGPHPFRAPVYAFDLDSFPYSDCNMNGIPDECEPDCNNNGTPDECDIAGFLIGYTIVDLGVPAGSQHSVASDMNEAGHIVGAGQLSPMGGSAQAFYYADGRMEVLPCLPGTDGCTASSINNVDQITGGFSPNTNRGNSVFWERNSFGEWVPTVLFTPGEVSGFTLTYGINDLGQVTGSAARLADPDGYKPFVWQPSAAVCSIQAPSRGFAINSMGQVSVDNYGQQPMLFTPNAGAENACTGFLTAIPGLGRAGVDIGALNNLGQVGGYEYDPSTPEESHAFLWTPSIPNGTTGTTRELLPLPGDTGAQPAYIKAGVSLDSTTIVGRSFIVEAMPRAVLWHVGRDGQGNSVVRVFDLNDLIPAGLGWELKNAKAINSRGQIAGDGTIGGSTHAFLLTPVNDCNGNSIPDECDITNCSASPQPPCSNNCGLTEPGCSPCAPDPCAACAGPCVCVGGQRTLLVTPQVGALDAAMALRVVSANYSCLDSPPRYIDENGCLGPVPVCRTAGQWGTVTITDQDIIPSTHQVPPDPVVYQVVAECCSPCAGGPAASNAVEMPEWGDVNGDGFTNNDDVLCLLDTFAGNPDSAACLDRSPGCISMMNCQPVPFERKNVAPCIPDAFINLEDVLAVLNAFAGQVFPCALPCGGACCLPGACELKFEADCSNMGGTFAGPGTACTGDACSPNPCPSP